MIWHLIHDSLRGTLRLPGQAAPGIIGCGSVLCEADLGSLRVGVPLLFMSDPVAAGTLTLTLLDDGRLYLMHRRGGQRVGLSVAVPRERVRITYNWDSARRNCLLTCECLDSGVIRQSEGAAAPCMSRADMAGFGAGSDGGGTSLFRGEWLAIGEGRHLPGQAASMAGRARIATPAGEVALGHLRPGMRVLTLDAGEQEVLWSGAARVPALGSFRPVRLLAPFFGEDEDLLVPPHQRIVVSGNDIEYLLGEREFLIEARHLVNGTSAIWDDSGLTVVWYGLLLGGHHLVLANGCPTETLHVGRLAESPSVARTTAFGPIAAAGGLPVHRSLKLRTVSGYEAMAITSALSQRIAPVSA